MIAGSLSYASRYIAAQLDHSQNRFSLHIYFPGQQAKFALPQQPNTSFEQRHVLIQQCGQAQKGVIINRLIWAKNENSKKMPVGHQSLYLSRNFTTFRPVVLLSNSSKLSINFNENLCELISTACTNVLTLVTNSSRKVSSP